VVVAAVVVFGAVVAAVLGFGLLSGMASPGRGRAARAGVARARCLPASRCMKNHHRALRPDRRQRRGVASGWPARFDVSSRYVYRVVRTDTGEPVSSAR